MNTKKKLQDAIMNVVDAREAYLQECRELEMDPDPGLLEVPFSNGTAKSIRDAILQSVSATTPTAVTDIFNRVRQMGIESHEVSIRNEISKLKNQGSLTQQGHGTYLRTDVVPPKKKEAMKNAS